VLVSGETVLAANITVSPVLVVRDAPALIMANTSSANPSATLASSEPLNFATAPYHSAASAGVPPTVSRAYRASSAAPARMFCDAFVFS